MVPVELESEDDNVPELAVQALNAATRRAIRSGRSIVLVENGELVRIGSDGKTVLKKLPPRRKVETRFKRAMS